MDREVQKIVRKETTMKYASTTMKMNGMENMQFVKKLDCTLVIKRVPKVKLARLRAQFKLNDVESTRLNLVRQYTEGLPSAMSREQKCYRM